MKKIIISLIVAASQVCTAQNYYLKQFEIAQSITPTPQHSVELLSSVLPRQDIEDIKRFMAESEIPLAQTWPSIRIEGSKLYFAELSEPISVTDEGNFEYKGEKFRYNKNLSFKRNLDNFERSWGQLREFAKPKKTSALNYFLLTEARAADSFAKRALVITLVVISAVPLFLVYSVIPSKATLRDKMTTKQLTAKISCNPERFQLDDLDIQVQSQSKTAVNALHCTNIKKKSLGCDSLVTFDKIMGSDGKTRVKIKTAESLKKDEESKATDNQTLEKIMEETLEVCKSGQAEEFNKNSAEVAKYLVKNKLVRPRTDNPIISQPMPLPVSTPSGQR